MKQTLYEKIKTIVESWNIAITQNVNWKYILCSSLINAYPWIRHSDRWDSIQDCLDSIWHHESSEDDVNEFFEKYIWIYERPLWRPTKWQKVSVWLEDKWSTIFWEVVDLTGTYAGVKIIDSIHPVPYDCIAPRVEIDTI